MRTIENFIQGLDGQQKAIVSFLHSRLVYEFDLMGKIRFKIPMYYRKKWVCYLNPIKGNGVELAFMKGYRLSNDQGILADQGRKMVAGISIYQLSELPEVSVDEVIKEAIILDDLFKN